jgi:uncharacterized protein (DUF2237 family)
MKKQSQRYNQISIVTLASSFFGLRDGSRLCILGARSRGFNSPQVHQFNAPPISGNYRQGTSSGRSRKDGVSTPTVIFALAPEESKGENDVPQLPDRMQKACKDSQGPATVSLLPMLQNLF